MRRWLEAKLAKDPESRDLERSGKDPAAHWLYIMAVAELGDARAYRAATERILALGRKAADPFSLNNAAWFCCYVPDGVADPKVVVQMAEDALANHSSEQKRIVFNTLGAALYRAGRTDEAIARLDESVKASRGVGLPQDWAFLAMAHHKKGNADLAGRWLQKLQAYTLDNAIPFSNGLVECRILRKEAEALLTERAPKRP